MEKLVHDNMEEHKIPNYCTSHYQCTVRCRTHLHYKNLYFSSPFVGFDYCQKGSKGALDHLLFSRIFWNHNKMI